LAAGSRTMYRDLQREKRVKADHILGDLLARAAPGRARSPSRRRLRQSQHLPASRVVPL